MLLHDLNLLLSIHYNHEDPSNVSILNRAQKTQIYMEGMKHSEKHQSSSNHLSRTSLYYDVDGL
jgi:hypothetical protein